MQKLKLEQLNRPNVETYKQSTQKNPIVVVCDSIRSAMNVGSVFRTCDALAIEKIILCGISATPPNREIQKTALGATESVDWLYEESISESINQLKSEGYTIVAIEQTDNSTFLNQIQYNKTDKWAIILGNEVDGVSEEAIQLCDFALEIPQGGTKHSLNVSVAAGIVLWELVR
jgi:tRNA G18 (ribose-2'-O)-methylase SpoU